jgi:hypothetical protein
MKKNIILGLVVVFGIVIAGFIFFSQQSVAPTVPEPQNAETPAFTDKSDKITVSNIVWGSKITSPVSIQGEARGTWFFEASFPIEVRDEEGNVLGSGIATAKSEWMTENFVPFSAQISFSAGGKTNGFLALIKDNPSGEPEFDDELLIPVSF